MRNELFSVHDSKADVWSNELYSFPNASSAVREFCDALRDPKTALGRHPEDFDLYRVGYYDLETGEIEPCLAQCVLFGRVTVKEVSE